MFQPAIPAEDHHASKAGEFPLFDWLRLILASIVALSHESVIKWGPAGNLAVQVFFALSGWLIGAILLSTDRRGLPRFYYNRGTRIWIPYALAVALLYAVAAAHEGINSTWTRCLFFDGTFTHNWFIDPALPMPLHGTGNHFWSIAVEEQFYLAAPLLIVVLPFGRSVLFWALIAALAVLSRSWYGAISLGVLAAVARSQFGDWQLARARYVALIAALLAALMVILPSYYALAAPPFALAVVLLASREGRRTKIGEFAGAISYPLYLYHWIGMFVANEIAKLVGLPSVGLVAFGVALAVGTIAYLIVDRNVMRVRSRLYRPTLGRNFMVAAYALLGLGVLGSELI